MDDNQNQQLSQTPQSPAPLLQAPLVPARKNKLLIFLTIFVFLLITGAAVFCIFFTIRPQANVQKPITEVVREYSEKGNFKIIIEGQSMYPKYKDAEEHEVDVNFGNKKISRGDVLLLYALTEKRTVKRVIGLPDEKIMIKDGKVFIDGVVLEEPYLEVNTATNPGKVLGEGIEVLIPANMYAVLGDNRSFSVDSREWGFIKEKAIEGLIR